MHVYYVFHFKNLHVSVPLDHLQGAFCYRTHCCLNVQVLYISIYNVRAEYMLCVKMLKFTLVKMSDMPCVSVCISFGVQVDTTREKHAHGYTGHNRFLTNVKFLTLFNINTISLHTNKCLYIGHFKAKVFCDWGTLKMAQMGRNM
jgi:hypothetical protein